MLDGSAGGRRRRGFHGRARGLLNAKQQPVYGALDLGSNNCRLLIALPSHRGFRVVDAFSRIVKLGEGVGTNGRLLPGAMDRAIEALKICRAKMRRRGVSRMRGITTAACRRASNCGDFIDRVQSETGIVLDIVSPAEEAQLAVASCEPLIDRSIPNALVFDIGGGSTEIMWARVDAEGEITIEDWVSLPCGVITLAERFGGVHVPPAVYDAMIEEVLTLLRPFEVQNNLRDKLGRGTMQLLGTSGTATTVAGVYLNLKRYDRREVDGVRLSTDDFRRVTAALTDMTIEERRAQPCVGPDRADMVIAGCAILDAICRLWPFPDFQVADRGLREGLLLDMMRADGKYPETRVR
ncbi:MAG: Ppx/GppA phosphatase family protein [Sphingomonadales bacterium]